MSRKKQLEKEIKERREELHELEQDDRKVKNEKLLGKYFKYMNSFGSGEFWPIYFLVTRLDGIEPRCFRFEKDSHGTIAINFDDNYTEYDSTIQITKEEFDDALRVLLSNIKNSSENNSR